MPRAYHIIWTTYGTWLPGDKRGWMKKYCAAIQEPDANREVRARQSMAETTVTLTLAQRTIVERTISEHCHIRGWTLHAVNVRSNHIHVVVSADRAPEEIINQFKAWCSRKLSDAIGLEETVATAAGRRRWFTEGGETRNISTEEYLWNAIRYVIDRQ